MSKFNKQMDTLKVLNEILAQLEAQGKDIKAVQNNFWDTFWASTVSTAIGALLAGASAWFLFWLQSNVEKEKDIKNKKQTQKEKIERIISDANCVKQKIINFVYFLNEANVNQSYYNIQYLNQPETREQEFNKKYIELYHERYKEYAMQIVEQNSIFSKLCFEYSVATKDNQINDICYELDCIPQVIEFNRDIFVKKVENSNLIEKWRNETHEFTQKYVNEVVVLKLEYIYSRMAFKNNKLIDIDAIKIQLISNLNKEEYKKAKDLFESNKKFTPFNFLNSPSQ